MKNPWQQFQPFALRFGQQLPPELAHNLALRMLRNFPASIPRQRLEVPRQCMGLEFTNPVGLAAGLDKNGVALSAWERCGFGFAEIGGVTPLAQPGNPMPRMFRLAERRGLINRMGFNNDGMAEVARRLERWRRRNPESSMRIGVNLGKNKATALEDAHLDYVALLEAFWPLADYLVLNISSPNTPQLRALGQAKRLRALLDSVCEAAQRLRQESGRETPLAIKIDPDQGAVQLAELVAVVKNYPIRALIATNTTQQRPSPIDSLAVASEAGGLSGAPLAPLALNVVKSLAPLLSGSDIEVIGCGGIDSAATAREFLDAGAKLVQIYTGFVYQGPQLLVDIVEGL